MKIWLLILTISFHAPALAKTAPICTQMKTYIMEQEKDSMDHFFPFNAWPIHVYIGKNANTIPDNRSLLGAISKWDQQIKSRAQTLIYNQSHGQDDDPMFSEMETVPMFFKLYHCENNSGISWEQNAGFGFQVSIPNGCAAIEPDKAHDLMMVWQIIEAIEKDEIDLLLTGGENKDRTNDCSMMEEQEIDRLFESHGAYITTPNEISVHKATGDALFNFIFHFMMIKSRMI